MAWADYQAEHFLPDPRGEGFDTEPLAWIPDVFSADDMDFLRASLMLVPTEPQLDKLTIVRDLKDVRELPSSGSPEKPRATCPRPLLKFFHCVP